MDRIYRRQRHFYDFTRKYYLLGRDRLIDDLAPPPDGRVLEIGCGTARNLVAAARAWPQAQLYGIDISAEMLGTARQIVLYGIALIPVSLIPSLLGMAGSIYLIGALLLGMWFLYSGVRVARETMGRAPVTTGQSCPNMVARMLRKHFEFEATVPPGAPYMDRPKLWPCIFELGLSVSKINCPRAYEKSFSGVTPK